MAQINIILQDSWTGKLFDIELPDDVDVKTLLSAIFTELKIIDFNQSERKLVNKSQGFEYNEKDTLSSRGTKPNSKCFLFYDGDLVRL